MNRFLRSFLCLLLVFAMLPVPAFAADALTEETVYQKMIALQEEYPEGTPWTNENFYAWNGGVFSGGYGCVAFALICSDAVFGDLPVSRYHSDFEDIRVGDMLRINFDTHSVVVLEKKDNSVIVTEGNYNDSIHWGREIARKDLEERNYEVTSRYPIS